jgi:hypothetical protein
MRRAHHPDVIPAGSAEYLPLGAVFTASQRIIAQKSTVYRHVSAPTTIRETRHLIRDTEFLGLADAQTALFTQPIS